MITEVSDIAPVIIKAQKAKFTEKGDHPIEVIVTGDESVNGTYYFDDMQTALNAYLHQAKDTSAKDDAQFTTTRKVTINLLRDMDGASFQIGNVGAIEYNGKTEVPTDSESNFKDYDLTINLNGHTYGFNEGINSPGEIKGIQFNRNRPSTATKVTITKGTLKVADKTDSLFSRLIRSYVDLTLTDVILDGTKLATSSITGRTGRVDYAALAHSAGTLTINGSTSVLTQADVSGNTFFGIGGIYAPQGTSGAGVNYNNEIQHCYQYNR